MSDSQWENFLKNKGEWHGSFTKFSPEGKKISDVPSILSLESFNDDRNARITLQRFYPQTNPDREPIAKTLVREFNPPLSQDLFCCDNGSFCRGMVQIYASSIPVIEFGLLQENRRSRQVQKYSFNGTLESITLIREQNSPYTPKGEKLEIEALLGTWKGEAIEVDRQMKTNKYQIQTKFDRSGDRLTRVTTVNGEDLTQTGKIKGYRVDFDSEEILLLEDGAWANFSSPIELGRSFTMIAGCSFTTNSSQRLKRCYNERGEWIKTIKIVESKV